LALVLVSIFTGAACGDAASSPAPIPPGCNPLAADWDCLLPYPSDHFLVDDPTLPSGRRVELPEPAQLQGTRRPIDMYGLHPADGFPIATPLLLVVPGGVDAADLVPVGDPARSLDADSRTTIVDAETGERVLHFAELDPGGIPDRQALIIRPLERLGDGRRYVVAVRGLRHPDGTPIRAPDGFRGLRDAEPSDDPALAAPAARYEADVFGPLEAAGVARDDLVLAWDFTTRTERNATFDMLTVREATRAWLAAEAPAITVVSVDDVPDDDRVAAQIEATVTAPLFLESTSVGAPLARGPDGIVRQNGTTEVPFTVLVPTSVAARSPTDPPARLLQFGHGFFGTRAEIAGAYVPELADERGFVVVGADWWGMSAPDREEVGLAIANELEAMARFTDRVHQAMANLIVLARAAVGPLSEVAELRDAAGPIFDPSELYFLGISQGHILGGTYLALSSDVRRGVLNVGGANLSMMMFRALPFVPFLLVVATVVDDRVEQQKLAVMAQSSFDRVDPISYAPRVVASPYPDAPRDRVVLISAGIADAAVTTLSAQHHARAVGAVHLIPAPREVVGLETTTGPVVAGAAYEEHDFGVAEEPAATTAADNDVHEGVRRLAAFKEQLSRFLAPGGAIERTCDGPCDPE
jgi:hypothetical protein